MEGSATGLPFICVTFLRLLLALISWLIRGSVSAVEPVFTVLVEGRIYFGHFFGKDGASSELIRLISTRKNDIILVKIYDTLG